MTKHFTAIALGALSIALVAAVSVSASGPSYRTTYLTFSAPVALPGVELTAGTYVFELADPNISNDVVRVWSHDKSRVYLTAYTRKILRPAGMTNRVMFGEAARGTAAPITAWFPSGSPTGHQFIYTK